MLTPSSIKTDLREGKQSGEHAAGLEHLPAEVMLDEPAHQRLGPGQGFGLAEIAPGHVEKHPPGHDRWVVDAVFVKPSTAPRSII